jgi:hypothetical protein
MNHLHYEFDLGPDDQVEVELDKQANVLLMDDGNYQAYRSGKKYRYHGGLAEVSPVILQAPRPGRWHLVIDLGGYPGTVRAGVVVQAAGRS